MNEVSTKKDTEVLALEIRTLQQQAESILTSYIVEIGRRLCEAKAVLDHGEWGQWLKEKVQFSQSTANNYMKIFQRYGTGQISLFGETNSQAIGNLPYTKALKLLAVPEEEVDDFLAENQVAEMSTRELEEAIKERDQARRALEDAKWDAETQISQAEEEAEQARQEAEKMKRELEELKNRPIEVAVQDPPEELLEQIRAEEAKKHADAEREMERKLAEAEEKAKKEQDRAKKLKEKAEKAGEEARAAMRKDMDAAAAAQKAAEAEKIEAEARAKALEEKLKTANGDAAIFKVYFQGVQEDMNRMLGIIQKATPEQKEKYRTAMGALLSSIGRAIEIG